MKQSFLVTINNERPFRVWAFDIDGACRRASQVREATIKEPAPIRVMLINAEAEPESSE